MNRRESLLAAETALFRVSPHGAIRLAVGYPNDYCVAQSSLAYQWVVQLAAGHPDVGVERFFDGEDIRGATLDSGAPLARFDVLALSWAFEPDGVGLLRTLVAAGIPPHREERSRRHPLVVVGGAAATINPLPLASAVDVFCLGAAERTLGTLLELVQRLDRPSLLDELASRDGFFVPARHLASGGRPARRLRRLELRRNDPRGPVAVPASYLITPHTEYGSRSLVELSRGCVEKCSFCWVGHAYGGLRCHPEEAILRRIDELRTLGPRFGLIATAVGDHPGLARILGRCADSGLDVAISSLRIPALTDDVLEPLAACGARSITIAPECGSDRLRQRLGKSVTNESILEGVEAAQRRGVEGLKMYFMVGLPDEDDSDLEAIGDLVRRCREVVLPWGRSRGRLTDLRVSLSILVPKPYTPLHREPMLTAAEARRRVQIVRRALRGADNVRLLTPSYREALWQGYLSRAGSEAYGLVRELAAGTPLARILSQHREEVARTALTRQVGPAPYHFIATAPNSPASPG